MHVPQFTEKKWAGGGGGGAAGGGGGEKGGRGGGGGGGGGGVLETSGVTAHTHARIHARMHARADTGGALVRAGLNQIVSLPGNMEELPVFVPDELT